MFNATALLGATLADWQKKREEEARRLAELEAKKAASAGRSDIKAMRQAQRDHDAAVRARWAAQAQASSVSTTNAAMERKMARLDEVEDARWTASQAVIAQRAKEKDKIVYDQRMDEHDTTSIPAPKNDAGWLSNLWNAGTAALAGVLSPAKNPGGGGKLAAPALDDDPPEEPKTTPWENFKEWWRVKFLDIKHPEYLPSDSSAGLHGSRHATMEDRKAEIFFRGGEILFLKQGYDDAAAHMHHYLGNSGKDYEVDVKEMLNEIPIFKQESDITLRQLLKKTLRENYSGQNIEINVETNWKDINPDDQNWFYAMNGFNYSIGANIVVTPSNVSGGNPEVKVVYRIFVGDPYTWDTGKSTTFPKGDFEWATLPDFNAPYKDKIVDLGDQLLIYDTALQELHKAGLAQEFRVVGETDKIIVEYEYDQADKKLIPVE